MTAAQLKDYLTVCKDAGLVAFVLRMGGDEVHGTFDVKMPEVKPEELVPGGWKGGPVGLDDFERLMSEDEQPRSAQ